MFMSGILDLEPSSARAELARQPLGGVAKGFGGKKPAAVGGIELWTVPSAPPAARVGERRGRLLRRGRGGGPSRGGGSTSTFSEAGVTMRVPVRAGSTSGGGRSRSLCPDQDDHSPLRGLVENFFFAALTLRADRRGPGGPVLRRDRGPSCPGRSSPAEGEPRLRDVEFPPGTSPCSPHGRRAARREECARSAEAAGRASRFFEW